ncbi:cbs domain protein [hydrocarbon metagenome]|uniref:Cbs domain protein n=1 Tax=hydrocarbon metagenome TaxID=938273 RepID=A0A0W8F2L7_9ZZZZ
MKRAMDFLVDFPLLRSDDHITKARQTLRDNVCREAFVHDGKRKLLGYIDITDVLRVTATKSNVTIDGFRKNITPVHPGDPVRDVLVVIRENRTDSVPVVDDQGLLLGGVPLSELFPVVITMQRLQGLVSDCMTQDVVTCTPSDTVQRIHTLIVDSGYTAFPVVKKKTVTGMISRRDLLKDGRWRTGAECTIAVESLMKAPVYTIGPDEPVAAAASLMVRHDISRLPVVEEGLVVGIIDRHDVLTRLS